MKKFIIEKYKSIEKNIRTESLNTHKIMQHSNIFDKKMAKKKRTNSRFQKPTSLKAYTYEINTKKVQSPRNF